MFRARAASRSGEASFGINHHSEVLTGADTERIRKWQHDQLTTFGIGTEHARDGWQHIGRELVRLGFLRLASGEFPTVELTEEGAQFLKARPSLALTRPPVKPERTRRGDATAEAKPRAYRKGDIVCDEALFEKLRLLRREIADSRSVPAYIVFGDVSLRVMARDYPVTEREMEAITGVGVKKLEDFGAQFLDAILKHLRENPRQAFLD